MSPVFASRRRADEFASLVERASTTDVDAGRDADLLALVAALRDEPAPQPRAEFVADLRTRLMAAAETELVPARTAETPAKATDAATTSAPPRRTRRDRRVAALVGGFAIVSASTSMAVAAQSALPGDTLYPLKRAIENVHAGVVRGDDDKGETLLANAAGRLDEVDALSRSGEQDAAVISETLRDFADQAGEASELLLADYAATGRDSSIEQLRDFAADSMTALEQLDDLVPTGARGSLADATAVLEQIERDTVAACPSCLGDVADSVRATASGIPPILDQALAGVGQRAPVTTPDAADDTDDGRPTDPTGPTGQPEPPASPGPTTAASDDPPVDDPSPSLPDPKGPDTTADDPPADDPIGDLVTGATGIDTSTQGPRNGQGNGQGNGNGGSDDPVGDLLDGVEGTVDGVLGGG